MAAGLGAEWVVHEKREKVLDLAEVADGAIDTEPIDRGVES